jgi:hypothetical protein
MECSSKSKIISYVAFRKLNGKIPALYFALLKTKLEKINFFLIYWKIKWHMKNLHLFKGF